MFGFGKYGKERLTEMNTLKNEMVEMNEKVSNPHHSNELPKDNKNGMKKMDEKMSHYNNGHGWKGKEQTENEFTKKPLNCEHCNKHVHPLIKSYTPIFVYILVILLFLFISFFTICLLPILYLTFKEKKYVCPICDRTLVTSESSIKITRENKIITLQLQKLAIIVSEKYLALFLLLIFLIFFFYILRISTNMNFDSLAKGPNISVTWVDYLDDCGNKSQFRNSFNSAYNFKKKYYGNTIKWEGNVVQIREGFFSSNVLYVKMNPSEYKNNKPDVMALFNDSLIKQVQHLQQNDLISFECTLIQISRNKDPHTCLLWNVVLLKKYQNKNVDIINFVKHMSIFDIINHETNLNPFFIRSKDDELESEIINTDDNDVDNNDLTSYPSGHSSDSIKVINVSSTSPKVSGVMVDNEYIVNVDADDMDALSNITGLNYINPNHIAYKESVYKQVLNDIQLNSKYPPNMVYNDLYDNNEDMDNKIKLSLKDMDNTLEHKNIIDIIHEEGEHKHYLNKVGSSYMDSNILDTIYEHDIHLPHFNEVEHDIDAALYDSLVEFSKNDSIHFSSLNGKKVHINDYANSSNNIHISNGYDNIYVNKNPDTTESSILYDRNVEPEQTTISDPIQIEHSEKNESNDVEIIINDGSNKKEEITK
ncbi:conserved Plasmodium protein, unknown function [Plasmodium vinckei vinckei]|uniref:LITAF domain-containing protein n=1 Tax=Plasmodium vinckei vinckei TaxID=54757 RepID=A0A081ICX4_PLAVN|nr:conserved Plasmodium protein, unknown function [Plasmodium vinckei vinckei]KEG01532.1 hypothetical protein YYE_03630 [Plasmodium vinckei vinckei]VEV55512.1 conserved Plasmodium protein, unknown function [Plasmodium vinckei vinckei]